MTDPNESSIEARRTASSRSRTRRPVRKDEKAAAIRPRFRGVSASSAAPRAQSGISEPSAPRTAPTARGMVVVTTAAESERAAVTHSVFTPPTAPMRNAATAGPTMVMSESIGLAQPQIPLQVHAVAPGHGGCQRVARRHAGDVPHGAQHAQHGEPGEIESP